MKPKPYPLIRRCVEDGAAYGVRRAHKHADKPAYEEITEAVVQAVMSEIHEAFTFDDEESE